MKLIDDLARFFHAPDPDPGKDWVTCADCGRRLVRTHMIRGNYGYYCSEEESKDHWMALQT